MTSKNKDESALPKAMLVRVKNIIELGMSNIF
jgi:hypothetical protein